MNIKSFLFIGSLMFGIKVGLSKSPFEDNSNDSSFYNIYLDIKMNNFSSKLS
jgi:hypothetical protein